MYVCGRLDRQLVKEIALRMEAERPPAQRDEYECEAQLVRHPFQSHPTSAEERACFEISVTSWFYITPMNEVINQGVANAPPLLLPRAGVEDAGRCLQASQDHDVPEAGASHDRLRGSKQEVV